MITPTFTDEEVTSIMAAIDTYVQSATVTIAVHDAMCDQPECVDHFRKDLERMPAILDKLGIPQHCDKMPNAPTTQTKQ